MEVQQDKFLDNQQTQGLPRLHVQVKHILYPRLAKVHAPTVNVFEETWTIYF
jgi:hypothetical protein